MNENNEVRLIDANAAKKSLLSYYSFVNENTSKSNYTGETLMSYEVADMIEDCMDNAPTIDPETIPIVRQLREELARVTAERDAAVKDFEQAITIYRDVEGWDILCRFCNGKSCRNDGECKPEWRGPQKEE